MSIVKRWIISAITIAVLFVIVVFILWIIPKTHKVQFHVIDADTTQFNLTDDSKLFFNLSVDMAVKNPNLHFGVFFDRIEVAVLYKDIQISNTSLSPFYQGKDGARLFKMKFDGHELVKLNAKKLAAFSLEKAAELFFMKLELRFHIRVTIGPIKFKFKPKVRCGINVPLVTRGKSPLRFQIVGCYVAY